MGLHAHVCCACFERGLTRSAPPAGLQLVAEADGSLAPTGAASHSQLLAMDRWRKDACEHPDGIAIRRRIGNVARVADLRATVADEPGTFPLLLGLVLDGGAHAGDWIAPEIAKELLPELDGLARLQIEDAARHRDVQHFAQQMRELIELSLAMRKPIAF